MIRVLQVTGGLNTGGLETVAMNIVRYSDRNNVSFDFLVYGDRIGDYEEEAKGYGCNIIHMHRDANYIKFYNSIREALLKNGPYDAVYSHTFFNSGIIMRAAKSVGVRKCISHAHQTERTFDRQFFRSLFYRLMRIWLRKYADIRIACSSDAGEYVFGKGSHYTVVKNGISIERFLFNEDRRNAVRSELSLGNSFVVGNIGRISEAKNHKFIIDIFRDIHSLHSNSKLLIVGDGPLKDLVQEQVNYLNLSDSVVFTGSRNDVPDLLSAMDVFLFPSIHEGVGISAIESQASGLVTLCSDTVPVEVKASHKLLFLSLMDGSRAWAEEACKYIDRYDRNDTKDEIIAKGYDISMCMDTINNLIIS